MLELLFDKIMETKILGVSDSSRLPKQDMLYKNQEVPKEITKLVTAIAAERDVRYDPKAGFEAMVASAISKDAKKNTVYAEDLERWIKDKTGFRSTKSEVAEFIRWVSYENRDDEMTRIQFNRAMKYWQANYDDRGDMKYPKERDRYFRQSTKKLREDAYDSGDDRRKRQPGKMPYGGRGNRKYDDDFEDEDDSPSFDRSKSRQ